jgi:hypothetical protein
VLLCAVPLFGGFILGLIVVNVSGRDLAAFPFCLWAVVIGFYYFEFGVPLRPLVLLGLLLSMAALARSLRSRDVVGSVFSVASLVPIALFVVAVFIIVLGGGWE